jgi:hypothetical protein
LSFDEVTSMMSCLTQIHHSHTELHAHRLERDLGDRVQIRLWISACRK